MASAGISSSSTSSPRGVGAATNPAGRLRVGKKVKLSASKMITAIASNRKRRSRAAAASSTSHDRPCGRGTNADLGLGLLLPGPQFRPLHLCGASYCFTAIDPTWGGGYAFYKRSKKKNGKWKPVFDEEMIWLLTAAVTVGGGRTMAVAGPQRTLGGGIGGICTALRARGVELDAGVTAHALTFLDGISLTRTESVSLSFRHEISRIAWDDLANGLSEQMKDRAQKRWKVRQAAGEANIRSKDMVIYAQKEKIALDYVDEVVDMKVYELACKGRILSEVYPKADDYDIFIRFTSGDKVLCEGFFDLVDDITVLQWGKNCISLDDADLSQWPEMEDFLKCLRLPLTATSEDVIRELYDGMKPWNLVFSVVAIHNRSLQPSIIFSENQHLDCESGERAWGDGEFYIEDGETPEISFDISMTMDFAARHGGEYDLNDVNLRPRPRDPRQFVQGDLSLRPVVPDQKYGWTRYCSLEFDTKTPWTWRMEFSDEHKES